MSLSLDGSTAALHDGLRGIPGTFNRTLQAARDIVSSKIPLQINTLVTDETQQDLAAIHELVREVGAERWSLFFLVTTGRGSTLKQVTPAQADAVLNWALDHAADQRPIVTTTEAPHYRRLAVMRYASRIEHPPQGPMVRRGLGIRDGNGVMFISHTGDVQPSGFLPLTAGNVRTENPLQIYRASPLFQSLRRTDQFEGRCGVCEFQEICGGSRARAYAATGSALGSDPPVRTRARVAPGRAAASLKEISPWTLHASLGRAGMPLPRSSSNGRTGLTRGRGHGAAPGKAACD